MDTDSSALYVFMTHG